MAQRDGAPVRIEPVVIELQLTVACQDLSGEGFVELDHLEVLQRKARLLQHLAGGGDHADPHVRRVHTGGRVGNDAGEWLAAL